MKVSRRLKEGQKGEVVTQTDTAVVVDSVQSCHYIKSSLRHYQVNMSHEACITIKPPTRYTKG